VLFFVALSKRRFFFFCSCVLSVISLSCERFMFIYFLAALVRVKSDTDVCLNETLAKRVPKRCDSTIRFFAEFLPFNNPRTDGVLVLALCRRPVHARPQVHVSSPDTDGRRRASLDDYTRRLWVSLRFRRWELFSLPLFSLVSRERHAVDKDDMGGVGSFSRNNRTLYIGNLAQVK
jgi:hypothetical protein